MQPFKFVVCSYKCFYVVSYHDFFWLTKSWLLISTVVTVILIFSLLSEIFFWNVFHQNLNWRRWLELFRCIFFFHWRLVYASFFWTERYFWFCFFTSFGGFLSFDSFSSSVWYWTILSWVFHHYYLFLITFCFWQIIFFLANKASLERDLGVIF